MDKNVKQAKLAKAKAEEAALNRILCWMVGGVVLEFFLLLLNRYVIYSKVSEYAIHTAVCTAMKILAVAALVCAAAAGYWWKNARSTGKKSTLSGGLCLFLIGLSLCCFGVWFFYNMSNFRGVELLLYVVPVVVVLALVYYLYQREFFFIACGGVLALLGVWGAGHSTIFYAYVALSVVLVLLGALLTRKAQSGQGLVEWQGKSLRIFGKDANYALLYTGAAVALGVLIVSLFSVPSVVLYGAVAAWLLIMAVYYTVKLM